MYEVTPSRTSDGSCEKASPEANRQLHRKPIFYTRLQEEMAASIHFVIHHQANSLLLQTNARAEAALALFFFRPK